MTAPLVTAAWAGPYHRAAARGGCDEPMPPPLQEQLDAARSRPVPHDLEALGQVEGQAGGGVLARVAARDGDAG